MTTIGEELGQIEGAAKRLLHGHGHRAPAPSFTPAAQSQQAQPSQPEVPPVSVLSTVHKDLSAAGGAIQHAWPLITQIATNPLLDDLVEAGLDAVGAGAAEEVFTGVVEVLKASPESRLEAVIRLLTAVHAGTPAPVAQQPVQPPAGGQQQPADGAGAQPAQQPAAQPQAAGRVTVQ